MFMVKDICTELTGKEFKYSPNVLEKGWLCYP